MRTVETKLGRLYSTYIDTESGVEFYNLNYAPEYRINRCYALDKTPACTECRPKNWPTLTYCLDKLTPVEIPSFGFTSVFQSVSRHSSLACAILAMEQDAGV